MDDETWKEVVGFERYYMVSNFGRVRSLGASITWRTPRILKPKQHQGYNSVCLCKPGIRKEIKISRLVAAAFIGPKPNGFDVCHNNGVRSDDRLENLRYDTRKGNQADRLRHGTDQRGEKQWLHKLTKSQVQKIREDKRTLKAIAAEYGVTYQCIGEIRHKRNWKHVV